MGNISVDSKLHNLLVRDVSDNSADCFSIGLNEVALILKLQKLIEKLNKLKKKKDVASMIDIVFDVKIEIEAATGSSISITKSLDHIHKEMQQQGYNVPKKQWSKFTKKFTDREKRNGHRAEYIAKVLADPEGVFDFDEENLRYMSKHQDKKKDKKEDQEEQNLDIPDFMAWGISAALCGLFLILLPIPKAKEIGTQLIAYGLGIAVQEGFKHDAEKKEKDKKK